MGDDAIEVIEADDEEGTMPVLTDEQKSDLAEELWTLLRSRAGTQDVAEVCGMLLCEVLLQIFGDPLAAYAKGAGLIQMLMSNRIVAEGCGDEDCTVHGHGKPPSGEEPS